MTFHGRRAFHIGGASWLLLCAMSAAARWLRTPPPPSTQLPEITVTAPSPIERRNVVPSRTPGRVARAVPGRNRERSAAGATARRRQPLPPAGRAARRDRPVRDGHGGAERGNPPRRRRHARRSPVLQTRHHRLQLRAGRLEPADHPGSRRQSRRHRRKRHGRWRRLRSRRGSFRADRSARDQPDRGGARPRRAALRLDLDRRRRQRHQQSHSGCPALMRGSAVPELRPAGQGAARDCGEAA